MNNPAENPQKEPLLRIAKRAELPAGKIVILRLLAVVLSLVAGGIFIACMGQNPLTIYGTILSGACRSAMAFQGTVKLMIPLLITSLGVTLAFKMKFWNIGAEGQIIFGAILFRNESCPADYRDVFGRIYRRRIVGADSSSI